MSGRFGDFIYGSEMPQGPCRDCAERAAGCHAKCRRYALYKQICRAQLQKRHAESRLDEADARRERIKERRKKR